MDSKITLRVSDILGSPLCISAEDGQRIFDKLQPLLKEGRQIEVSFERITVLISLFLNAAIGQLYGSFSDDEIRSHIKVTGLDNDDMEMLRRVKENAQNYYARPEEYDRAWEAEEDEEDEK